jgi:RNA-directed DNA polymerase
MRRESHVRACEGGGVRFPSATRLICHCRSEDEARALWNALEVRFTACRLVLHPQKTKLIYCKDANRRKEYLNQSFDFLGYRFQPRSAMWPR